MKVSKLIHDLEKELTDIRQANLKLSKANEIFRQENIDLHEQIEENKSAIDECVFLRNENEGFLEEIKELKKENVELKSNMELGKDWEYDNDGNHVAYSKDDLNRQITNLRIKQRELEKENVKLVAQLENDEHNVGHLDEKMKRLDYLEKVFASNRYVFSEIPNTPENLKMVKMMKKYVNKRRYNLRWRGQYLIEGENWKKYQDGQPLSKSKCIRVYIDSLTHAIDTVEGFNMSEVKLIMDSLDKQIDANEDFIRSWSVNGEKNEEVEQEKRELNIAKELFSYFESMMLHLENSASTPIKDLVNVVIPKGDKSCHTK